MDVRNVSSVHGAAIERIARWWTSATQEARFEVLLRAYRKDPTAPSLREIQLAAYLAEAEAGEVAEG